MSILKLSTFLGLLLCSHSFASSLFYTKGEVKVDGQAAQKGDEVKVGQIIETGPGALAIIDIEGGSKLKVEPNGQVKLTLLNHEKKGSLISLLKGKIITKARKLETDKDRLQIDARKASFAVRGTLFFVGIDNSKKQDDVWMCVEHGEVVVRGSQEKKVTSVKAGEGVVVKNAQKTSAPAYFPWTSKINWEVEETSEIKDNEDVIEKAYANPLRRSYD